MANQLIAMIYVNARRGDDLTESDLVAKSNVGDETDNKP